MVQGCSPVQKVGGLPVPILHLLYGSGWQKKWDPMLG